MKLCAIRSQIRADEAQIFCLDANISELKTRRGLVNRRMKRFLTLEKNKRRNLKP
jgi:hypothetical protein